MKAYLLSLGVGALVGIIYAAVGVRSPAPPLVALTGLLGMLLGEQVFSPLKTFVTGQQESQHIANEPLSKEDAKGP